MDIMKFNAHIMFLHVLKKWIQQFHHMQIMEHNVVFIINMNNVNKIVKISVFIIKEKRELQ